MLLNRELTDEEFQELQKRFAVPHLFKVQIPIMTNDPRAEILVYDEQHEVDFHLPMLPELIEIANDLFKRDITDSPYKFYIMGAVDEDFAFNIWPEDVHKEDQEQEW